MKTGKEDGLNVVYYVNGAPILHKGEKILSSTIGEFHNPHGTFEPWEGFLYITNMRLIFIGRELFFPSVGISVGVMMYNVAKKVKRAKEDEQKCIRIYAELSHSEIIKYKKSAWGYYKLYMKLNNKKYVVTAVPKSKEFGKIMEQQYSRTR